MADFLVITSIWFWSILAAEIILLFICLVNDSGLGATISLVTFVALVQWFGYVDFLGLVSHNPLSVASAFVGYLGVGVCWSIFMWRKFVLRRAAEHATVLSRFAASRGLSPDTKVLPVNMRQSWVREVERTKELVGNRWVSVADKPMARHNKSKIVAWMSLWVFSVVLYVFRDMIVEAFGLVYDKIAFFLQRISDKIWDDAQVKENLVIPAQATGDDQDGPSSR